MNVSAQKTIKIVSYNEEGILCSNGKESINMSIHNFQNVCRFCLFGPAELNLFQTEYKKTTIHNICMFQFSILINLNDGLPVNICKKCDNKIRDLSSFRTYLLEVEHILKKVLQNKNDCKSKTKITEEITDIVFESVSDDDEGSFEEKKDNCASKIHEINFTCKYCKETFNKPLEYKNHLKEEQKKRKGLFLPCKICKKLYTKRKLATHMKIHLNMRENQSFQCDMCGKNYRTKRNLSRHYLTHAGMPHVCEVCGKGFREANLLKDHLNIHRGISPYLCNLCGKSYATSSALRLHRAYTHNGMKRKNYKYPKKTANKPIKKALKGSFPCEICGKVYSSRSTVNYHVLTHSDEKKFQCNDCGKMFANRSILGDHRRIHRLSYKCTYCERSFAYAASLETHINSHTGEKPHGCTVCGKRYSNRSHLKEHMRNHTGERPYSCTLCGKTFAVKGNLNAHFKTHAKNRSGPCVLRPLNSTQWKTNANRRPT